MGISARHLLELLIASRDDDGRYLSLVLSDDENEVSLAFDNGIKRHSARLSLTETDAILAALNRCGVSDDDPLEEEDRLQLWAGQYRRGRYRKAVRAFILTAGQYGDRRSRHRANTDIPPLRQYRYDGKRRLAHPERLKQDDHVWHIEVFDYTRQQDRQFQLSHIQNLEPCPLPTSEQENRVSNKPTEKAQKVTLSPFGIHRISASLSGRVYG